MTDDMGGMAGFDWQAARCHAAEQEVRRLTTEIDALRAELARMREPLRLLANGTRFKMSFFDDLSSSLDPVTGVCCFNNFRDELQGQWVALVPADDNEHLRCAANCATTPLSDKQAIKLIEQHTNDDNVIHGHEAISLVRAIEAAHGITNTGEQQ